MTRSQTDRDLDASSPPQQWEARGAKTDGNLPTTVPANLGALLLLDCCEKSELHNQFQVEGVTATNSGSVV